MSTIPWFVSNDRHEWMSSGLCLQTDPEIFFGTKIKEALEICKKCPVRNECLDWTLEEEKTTPMWGILGGQPQKTRHEDLRRCKYPGCKVNVPKNKQRNHYCSQKHRDGHAMILRREADYRMEQKLNKDYHKKGRILS